MYHMKVKAFSFFKGLASYRKAETTFTFHFSFLTLSNAFLSINNREMKIESGFSFAMASQPFTSLLVEGTQHHWFIHIKCHAALKEGGGGCEDNNQ